MNNSIITGLAAGATVGAVGAETIFKAKKSTGTDNFETHKTEKANENEQIEVAIEESMAVDFDEIKKEVAECATTETLNAEQESSWKQKSERKMEILEKQKTANEQLTEISKQQQEIMKKAGQNIEN